MTNPTKAASVISEGNDMDSIVLGSEVDPSLQDVDTVDTIELYPETSELALEQQKLLFQAIWDTSNALDQKAFQIVSAGTIVLMLAAVFQVNYDMERSTLYWGIITVGLICHLGSMFLALSVTQPRVHDFPYPLNLVALETTTLNLPKEEAVYQMLVKYIESSKKNLAIVDEKSNLVQWSRRLLVVATILFAASLIFGL